MNLFDHLVGDVLARNDQLQSLQPAVEKEILHHDIIRELSHARLLKNLTFIGGTCLRDCYNSPRLSEDLDFTGGIDFNPEPLSELKLAERSIPMDKFLQRFKDRCDSLSDKHSDFLFEIRRFLPPTAVDETLKMPAYWSVVRSILANLLKKIS